MELLTLIFFYLRQYLQSISVFILINELYKQKSKCAESNWIIFF